MTPPKNTIDMASFTALKNRVSAIELEASDVKGRVGIVETGHGEHKEMWTRLDEKVRSLGEQAQVNSRLQAEAMETLKSKINEQHAGTQNFINTRLGEVEIPINRIAEALGLNNKDNESMYKLRENMAFVDASRTGRQKIVQRVKDNMVNSLYYGLLACLLGGAAAWVVSHTGQPPTQINVNRQQ